MTSTPDGLLVIMWKPVVMVAVVASALFITPSEGTEYPDKPPPKKCPKNEVFNTCPNPCPPLECGVNKALILCAPAPIPGTSDCKPACICADGFLRNKAGVCIPEAECPCDCPKNETFDPCISPCPPRYCGVNITTISCAPPKDCVRGCRCSNGFLRNGDGLCVHRKDCPKCTRPKEVYDVCPNPCPPRRCDVDPKVIRCAAPPNPGDPECEPGCRCADGYVRNSAGRCVTRDQCPPVCVENEVFSPCCNGGCGPWTCADVGFPTGCVKMDQKYCKEGCIIKEGYVRENEKSPVCNNNEVSSDCINGGCQPKNCSQLGKPVPCIKMDPQYCIKGCLCKDGYLRARNGTCVPEKECDPLTCGNNEVYDTCANGGCQKRNCTQFDEPALCIDPIKCEGGCVCQEGYLRAEDGSCITEDQCPRKCKQSHEIYDPCPPICPPQTCDSIGKKYFCPAMIDNRKCIGACRCEPGYLRNMIGQCVSKKDCLKCTNPNELFSCGGACDNVCATLDKQNQTNCPIINIKCNPMCYCEEGYARNDKNICIPIDQCPVKCTGPNEHFVCGGECDNVCTTLQKQNQTHCPIINKRCTPKCYCDEGYARDDYNICIPIEQCGVSCQDDPNAIPGCGNYCGRSCSDYNQKHFACPYFCFVNSCDCKQSYVYDDNLEKCVQPKDCTPICGVDEVYNTCINGGCQKKKCSDLEKPDVCVRPKTCLDGCLCKEGFLRADNGTCVPINECPNICTGAHEVFNSCPSPCPPQTCESLSMAYICPIEWGQEPPCKPGCVCEDGYYRNKRGECISEKDCLKCTGPNEFFSCGGACDNVCQTLNKQNQTNCPIVNIQCNRMCYCEEGYARDASKICIPIEDCPQIC